MVAELFRASGKTPIERITVWGVWGYLFSMFMAWVGLRQWGDVWGPMTVLLFGPRWVLLIPVVGLGLAALRLRPRLLVPLFVSGAVVVGPVMGFNIGWRRWFNANATGMPLRIVTYNVAGGANLNTSLPWIIEETRADIIGFQECGSALVSEVRALPDIAWFTSTQDHLCLVSRYPIVGTRQLDRENFRVAGGSGIVIEYTIDLGDRQLNLTNLHLETPREGLAPVREGNVSEGFGRLQSKSIIRDIESSQARRWVDAGEDAIVVLGDFNLPDESVIYRRHWGNMRNAFSDGGVGFGFTRFAGWIRARIDHILVDEGWRVVRAFVGPDFGSDHRPMIADLVLTPLP
ncbi:endonuclease/exonuclease/phosphatase family protein [Gemmatimonadota bacterium]